MEKYLQISPHIFDCSICPTPCDGISKMAYHFKNDAEFSEYYENKLIDYINSKTIFKASKTIIKGYPDIELVAKNGYKFYIEVKVQRRTFMSVNSKLPQSGLKPSETVALNHSDLIRYFELEEKDNLQIFIFWVILNRPCIVENNKETYYYRLASELQPIYNLERDKRRFKRKSGYGDEVDGKHLGVTVNYHFSLNELKSWDKNL